MERCIRQKIKDSINYRLYFDKDVTGYVEKDQEKAEDLRFVAKDHFDIYEREVHRKNKITKADKDGDNFDDYFESVKYFVDKNGKVRKDIIDIRLKGLNVNNRDKDYDYVLEVRNFASATNTRNKMYRDYVDFDIPEKSKDFEIKGVYVGPYKAGRDTEISLEFSLPVDRVRAENPQAYLFDGAYDVQQLGGDIVVEENGYVVTLLIPDFDPADWSKLEVLPTLRDAFYGNRLSGTRLIDVKKGKLIDEIDEKDQTIDEAMAAIKNVLAKFDITEYEGDEALKKGIEEAVKKAVTGEGLKLQNLNVTITEAKVGEDGSIVVTGTLKFEDEEEGITITKEIKEEIVIPALEAQTLEEAKTAVGALELKDLDVYDEDNNFKSEEEIKKAVETAISKAVTNEKIVVTITDLDVETPTNAEGDTDAKDGSITATVILVLDNKAETVEVNITIPAE